MDVSPCPSNTRKKVQQHQPGQTTGKTTKLATPKRIPSCPQRVKLQNKEYFFYHLFDLLWRGGVAREEDAMVRASGPKFFITRQDTPNTETTRVVLLQRSEGLSMMKQGDLTYLP